MLQNPQPPEERGEAPSFWGIDGQGRRVKYEILLTFDVEDGGGDVHVVVYTDCSADEEGKLKLYAAQYPDGVFLLNMTEPPLEPLRSELWGAVQEVLDHVFQ